MTPDVVVDIGNSRVKWGLCRDGRVVRMAALQSANPAAWDRKALHWELPRPARWVVTAVNSRPVNRFFDWLAARGDEHISIAGHDEIGLPLAVDEPNAVGTDRLFSALAAVRRAAPGSPVATISVGTALTVDFVGPDGVFLGGMIAPGPRTMAKSLRDYTDRLPLIDPEPQLLCDHCGKNTIDAIQIGIQRAIVGAAVDAVLMFDLEVGHLASVFVTGGGYRYFASDDFADESRKIVLDPRLTLDGIRLAAEALP